MRLENLDNQNNVTILAYKMNMMMILACLGLVMDP